MKHSPPNSTLDDFLTELRATGVESEGEFTLDPIRAREMLRQFQLADPGHYILHLMSFLVGLSPSSLDVSIDTSGGGRSLTLTASETSLPDEILSNPFLGLTRQSERHLTELAIGLNAALGQPGCQVSIEYGEARYCYGEQIRREKVEQPWPCVRINVRRPEAAVRYRRTASSPGPQLEPELLSEHFCHCPTVLTVNGKQFSTAIPSGPGIFEWHLHNPLDPLWLYPNQESRLTEQHAARFSALLQIGDVEPGLDILYLGRLYRKSGPWVLEGSTLNCRLTIASSRLKKDLSQLEILEESTYTNLLSYLSKRLGSVLLRLLDPLASGASPPAELLDNLIDRAHRGGELDRAFQLQRRQYQRDTEGSCPLRAGLSAYRLALLEEGRGKNGQALRGEAFENFERWSPPGVLHFQGHPVSSEAYLGWLRTRSHYYLKPKEPNLAKRLLEQATLARDCPPMRELCYRWVLSLSDPNDPETLSHYARALYELGRLEEALEVVKRALQTTRLAPAPAQVGWDLRELQGQIAAESGRPEEAVSLLSGVLEEKRNQLGNDSLKLGLTLKRLIVVLDYAGDKKTASHYRTWVGKLEA